uniref:Uncharacterized protein n=1 Tax=Nelumbo nucifera TaxID=4432 RepID=A0A822ZIC1_NELNU|nr:TPA_asm: hypothetical protein HUJ06_000995 [Nelumbo nucifera]
MLRLSLNVSVCNDKSTSFNFSLASGSIKFPSLSNFLGGSNVFKANSGLFMK